MTSPVAYLGGGDLAPGPPFQPTIIFMMVFLAVLLICFSKTSKFTHSVTKKRQLRGDFVPRPPTGALPLPGPHWGTSVPQTPGLPPFAHSKYATGRHQSSDHLIPRVWPGAISCRCPIVTEFVSPAIFEIMGPKDIEVTNLTYQGHVTSSIT